MKIYVLLGLAFAAIGTLAHSQDAVFREAYQEIYAVCVDAEPQGDTAKCKGFRNGLTYCQLFDACLSEGMKRRMAYANYLIPWMESNGTPVFAGNNLALTPGNNTAFIQRFDEMDLR